MIRAKPRRALATATALCAGLISWSAAAHGDAHSKPGPAAAPVNASAIQKWVSPQAVEAVLRLEAQRGQAETPPLRESVQLNLLADVLFAREARALGLDRSSPEVQVAINRVLAQAFETQQRKQLHPTDAELRQRYASDLANRVKGVPNSTVPPFDSVKELLARNMVDERLARKLRALEVAAGVRPASAMSNQASSVIANR